MARSVRGSEGESLIEVLLALLVISLSVVALISGLATASRSALLHRDQADANTYLLRAADTLKAAAYQERNGDGTCKAAPYEDQLASIMPSAWTDRGGTVLTTTVRYWNGLTGQFDVACPATNETRSWARTQLVTISISAPGMRFTDSISVAKRILT